MKRILPVAALVLCVMMLLTTSACADQAAQTATAVPAAPAAAAAATAAAEAAPAEPAKEVDLLVGTWLMPPSPFDDDFACYVILNEDGSFLNVANVYDYETGKYKQMITTNETFRWTRTGAVTLELRYSYLDDNGEFVTDLTYNPKEDALYYGETVYATRDTSFVPDLP